MNTSVTSTGSGSFLQVWIRALTKPSESTYADIANSPKAKASSGLYMIPKE